MKLFTPDKGELLHVTSIEPHPDGLIIHGKIMGAMPMKAILRPEELRHTFKLFGPKQYWTVLRMLFRSSSAKFPSKWRKDIGGS
jgi:hypothetical protein